MQSIRPLLTLLLIGGISLSMLHPVSASAADTPETVEALVSALQARYQNIQTLQARFTQLQTFSVMGEVKSKGKVQVGKPRKARWETDGAQGSLFVTDGTKMSIYTPASSQVIVMSDMSQAGSGNVDILALLEDISKLDEQFEVSMVTDDPAASSHIVVNAKPRKPGGYSSVRLEFDQKNLDLSRVVFSDSMGGTTDLRFSDLKLDARIDDARFQFTPPDGVTVIDGGAM